MALALVATAESINGLRYLEPEVKNGDETYEVDLRDGDIGISLLGPWLS